VRLEWRRLQLKRWKSEVYTRTAHPTSSGKMSSQKCGKYAFIGIISACHFVLYIKVSERYEDHFNAR